MAKLCTARINGEQWTVESAKIEGLCDYEARIITLDPNARGRIALENLLHEVAHGVLKELTEEQVTRLAEHQARLAWRLGYRKARK